MSFYKKSAGVLQDVPEFLQEVLEFLQDVWKSVFRGWMSEGRCMDGSGGRIGV